MMRMGLLFMPPTQLLLHIKLYRMVVNSVPTWKHKVINPTMNPMNSVDAEGFKCCWFNCSFFKTFWNFRIAQTFSFNLNTSKPPILQWVWPLHHQRAVLECTLMSCETNVLFIPLLRCNRRHDESSLLCLFGHVSLFIVMLSMNYLTETDCYSAMNLTDLLCVLNNKTWAKCTKY